MTKAIDRLSEIRGVLEAMEQGFGGKSLSSAESDILRALKCLTVESGAAVDMASKMHCQRTRSKVSQAAYRAKLHDLVTAVDTASAKQTTLKI